MKENIISLDGLIKAIIDGKENGCNELVISGGEPTLFPDVIIKLLAEAEKCGYQKYIIQTNGSGLAHNSSLISFLNDLSKNKEVCISFSIHGHCSDIHDTMSSQDGALDLLVKAMENIRKTTCKIYTNTVVSSLNIKHLREIALSVLVFKPEIMQFSMMHIDTPNDLSTNLIDTANVIHELSSFVSKEILKTEGIPFCLMYGLEECVGEAYWPESLDLYNKDADYMRDFNQLDYGMRWKSEKCQSCIMNEICSGIWKEHIDEFISADIHPIC